MVQLKESEFISRHDDTQRIGAMLDECRQIESELEMCLKTGSAIDTVKFNDSVSAMLDDSNAILTRLRTQS
jgi:hypothetical protein